MELEHKPKSCWEVYSSSEHQRAMDDLAARYLNFLSRCKTERETVDFALELARDAGFSEDLAGDKVFRIFRGKTAILARRGKTSPVEGLRLIGAHADTPRLDLKQHPLYEDCGLGMAKTHYYGGIRKHQWLARPLALHGVVVTAKGETIPVCLGEELDEPVFTIADLLPHLAQKQAEKKLSDAFEAEKLNILLGHQPADKNPEDKEEKNPVKKRLLELLHQKYGIVEEDLYSAELQAVPAGPARPVGLDGSLLGGYGQDDRACVFTALEALLTSEAPEHTQVLLLWDKEEIGSDGSTGAKSRFLEYFLQELVPAWSGADTPQLSQVFMATKAVSADVHAPIDPDFQELHEKLNASNLGYGPCFSKFTGHRGKYSANDADAEYVAWFRGLLNNAGIPWQLAELGKVDQGGGGTVAKDLAVYCMNVIDLGPSVLSMHSPFEITSKADIYAAMLAYKVFLES